MLMLCRMTFILFCYAYMFFCGIGKQVLHLVDKLKKWKT